jgi:hypothetical protein
MTSMRLNVVRDDQVVTVAGVAAATDLVTDRRPVVTGDTPYDRQRHDEQHETDHDRKPNARDSGHGSVDPEPIHAVRASTASLASADILSSFPTASSNCVRFGGVTATT